MREEEEHRAKSDAALWGEGQHGHRPRSEGE